MKAAYLNESDLGKLKTIFWRHNIIGFTPFLDVPSRISIAQDLPVNVTVIGTWYQHAVPVPDGTTFKTGAAIYASVVENSGTMVCRRCERVRNWRGVGGASASRRVRGRPHDRTQFIGTEISDPAAAKNSTITLQVTGVRFIRRRRGQRNSRPDFRGAGRCPAIAASIGGCSSAP